MRLLVLSDLHREVWRDALHQAQEALSRVQTRLDECRPDVVILAGDIDLDDRAVAWADQIFAGLPVVYVSGNHEAYGLKLDSVKERLHRACAATGHVYYLDRAELVIEGVRILGATLWTDFQLMGEDRYPEAMHAAATGLNDYRKIRLAKDGYRRIRPLDTAQWHRMERLWLQGKLDQPFSGFTVVVTHMAPSGRSVPARFRGDLLSAAFASDLELMFTGVDLWVHGHVHDSVDYKSGKTRVVCNPLGYPIQTTTGQWGVENPAFDPNLIIQLPP